MKKLALLMVLVLVFSVSCVLATDAVAPISGEEISGETLVVSGETEATESEDLVVEENEIITEEDDTVSGEIVDTNINDNTNSNEAIEDEEIKSSSNNSATIGAIIAIVIVVAVVAIAAILRKD